VRRAALVLGATAAGLAGVLSYRTPELTAPAVTVAAATAPATAPATATTRTLTGDAADTRWGPVQVSVQLEGDRIVGVTVLQSPAGNRRDVQINTRALPVLEAEALQAQSADVDVVSGATYTSEGYAQSLQSALDQR
jgi:uncharacterized protein with FMN-binding domain